MRLLVVPITTANVGRAANRLDIIVYPEDGEEGVKSAIAFLGQNGGGSVCFVPAASKLLEAIEAQYDVGHLH